VLKETFGKVFDAKNAELLKRFMRRVNLEGKKAIGKMRGILRKLRESCTTGIKGTLDYLEYFLPT
jgi:hypothetical protein